MTDHRATADAYQAAIDAQCKYIAAADDAREAIVTPQQEPQMKTFKVEVVETVRYVYEVEAAQAHEAIEAALAGHLEAGDPTDFAVLERSAVVHD